MEEEIKNNTWEDYPEYLKLEQEITKLINEKQYLGTIVSDMQIQFSSFNSKKEDERAIIDNDSTILPYKKYEIWKLKEKELNHWRNKAVYSHRCKLMELGKVKILIRNLELEKSHLKLKLRNENSENFDN